MIWATLAICALGTGGTPLQRWTGGGAVKQSSFRRGVASPLASSRPRSIRVGAIKHLRRKQRRASFAPPPSSLSWRSNSEIRGGHARSASSLLLLRSHARKTMIGVPEEHMFNDLEPYSAFERRHQEKQKDGGPAIPSISSSPILDELSRKMAPNKWAEEVESLVEVAESRFAGGAGVERAESYLRQEFENIGLNVEVHDTECFIKSNGKRRYFDNGEPAFPVRNVIATLPGKKAGNTEDEYILIGAHFDSRNNILSNFNPAPGADDNGSGVAAVMQSARFLAEYSRKAGGFDKTIKFALFGGEEVGLIGSEAYVKSCVLPNNGREKMKGAIILDQIGFLKKNPDSSSPTKGIPKARLVFETVKTTTMGTSKHIENMVRSLGSLAIDAARGEDNIELYCNWFGVGSDHMPFLENDLPAVLLIARDYLANEGKHSSFDTLEKLDVEQGALISQIGCLAALHMAGYDFTNEASPERYEPSRSEVAAVESSSSSVPPSVGSHDPYAPPPPEKKKMEDNDKKKKEILEAQGGDNEDKEEYENDVDPKEAELARLEAELARHQAALSANPGFAVKITEIGGGDDDEKDTKEDEVVIKGEDTAAAAVAAAPVTSSEKHQKEEEDSRSDEFIMNALEYAKKTEIDTHRLAFYPSWSEWQSRNQERAAEIIDALHAKEAAEAADPQTLEQRLASLRKVLSPPELGTSKSLWGDVAKTSSWGAEGEKSSGDNASQDSVYQPPKWSVDSFLDKIEGGGAEESSSSSTEQLPPLIIQGEEEEEETSLRIDQPIAEFSNQGEDITKATAVVDDSDAIIVIEEEEPSTPPPSTDSSTSTESSDISGSGVEQEQSEAKEQAEELQEVQSPAAPAAHQLQADENHQHVDNDEDNHAEEENEEEEKEEEKHPVVAEEGERAATAASSQQQQQQQQQQQHPFVSKDGMEVKAGDEIVINGVHYRVKPVIFGGGEMEGDDIATTTAAATTTTASLSAEEQPVSLLLESDGINTKEYETQQVLRVVAERLAQFESDLEEEKQTLADLELKLIDAEIRAEAGEEEDLITQAIGSDVDFDAPENMPKNWKKTADVISEEIIQSCRKVGRLKAQIRALRYGGDPQQHQPEADDVSSSSPSTPGVPVRYHDGRMRYKLMKFFEHEDDEGMHQVTSRLFYRFADDGSIELLGEKEVGREQVRPPPAVSLEQPSKEDSDHVDKKDEKETDENETGSEMDIAAVVAVESEKEGGEGEFSSPFSAQDDFPNEEEYSEGEIKEEEEEEEKAAVMSDGAAVAEASYETESTPPPPPPAAAAEEMVEHGEEGQKEPQMEIEEYVEDAAAEEEVDDIQAISTQQQQQQQQQQEEEEEDLVGEEEEKEAFSHTLSHTTSVESGHEFEEEDGLTREPLSSSFTMITEESAANEMAVFEEEDRGEEEEEESLTQITPPPPSLPSSPSPSLLHEDTHHHDHSDEEERHRAIAAESFSIPDFPSDDAPKPDEKHDSNDNQIHHHDKADDEKNYQAFDSLDSDFPRIDSGDFRRVEVESESNASIEGSEEATSMANAQNSNGVRESSTAHIDSNDEDVHGADGNRTHLSSAEIMLLKLLEETIL